MEKLFDKWKDVHEMENFLDPQAMNTESRGPRALIDQ